MEHVGRSNQRYEREDYSPGEVIALERQGAECEPAAFPPMRVALVGNFAPRKCGIATFTTDVFEQLRQFHPQVGIDVYAMQDPAEPLEHRGAYAEIDRNDRAAYDRAARRMNEDGVDAVWLQHEFGIFGGECGEYVLRLVDRVAAPLVVTMHTVLSDPAPRQEVVTRRLVERASRIMVMCRKGRDTLIERYRAEPDRIAIIEHGAPDRRLRPLRSGAPRTLMTFGLLGPGKGLETVIGALPAVIARHPRTTYRIAGVSHPNEVRRNGEAYRDGLKALAERLGVAGHIEWVDRFLDTDDLVALLEDCDIYVTPYPNLQQSTSGTLSYAVALGRAIVSTPYVHARELLGDIGGVLVPVNETGAISRAVNRLLDNPAELEALQVRAYRRGRKTVWRHFADNSLALLQAAAGSDAVVPTPGDPVAPGLTGFDVLCDGTGILQHGKHIVPDRNHGYCLDDNARALMLVHRVSWDSPGEELRRAMPFASFVEHAWNGDAKVFRNFMN
ncbi:MAG: glycosyltransferase family 4 protein, partial [Novosphingobium sp.]|nr:glycosyltransferase family 4 protein [Novosphingobium sp.]